MKRLLLATAALVALSAAGHAAIVDDLGVNPTSAQGNFNQAPVNTIPGPPASFEDQITFQLQGGPQFITIASVTNTFAQPSDFIANFTAAVYSVGPNGIINDADDVAVIGPVGAGACSPPSNNCQGMAGTAVLNPGSFYLEFTGSAGDTAGYAGNLSTAPVPGPLVGAGIPGLLGLFGIGGYGLWRKRKA